MAQRLPKRVRWLHRHLSKIWPLFFWQRCEKCEKMFRRESGWQHLGPEVEDYFHYTVGNAQRYVKHHLCCRCAPTWEDACAHFGLDPTKEE